MALRISDLGTAPTVEETDLVEIAEVDGESPSGYSSYKTTILGIANKIATSTAFSGLVTTAKNIVGSINEVDGLLDLKESKADMEDDVTDILKDLSDDVTVTGNPVTFETINGGMAKSCEVSFSPIQSGSGDPSPTNIRPISGWDGLELKKTGKNLAKPYVKSASIISYDGNGNVTVNGTTSGALFVPTTSQAISDGILLTLKTGTYIPSLSNPYPNNDIFVNVISKDNTNLSQGNAFTITEDTEVYVRIVAKPGTYNWTSGIQLEQGSTATAYEPYQGETYPATFGQTVYGGSHEFVSGKAKSEWGYIASYNGETITEPWISDRDVYVAGTTPSTGAEVCYKLATPTEITLTAEQIELNKGTNVVSTDGDELKLVASKLANVPDLLTYIKSLEARIKALEEA